MTSLLESEGPPLINRCNRQQHRIPQLHQSIDSDLALGSSPDCDITMWQADAHISKFLTALNYSGLHSL